MRKDRRKWEGRGIFGLGEELGRERIRKRGLGNGIGIIGIISNWVGLMCVRVCVGVTRTTKLEQGSNIHSLQNHCISIVVERQSNHNFNSTSLSSIT